MNFIDRTIAYFAPNRALRRAGARAKMNMLQQFSNSGYSHNGASRRKKSMQGWDSSSRSPQEDIGQNLQLLRERSRDLYMSGGIGAAALKKNQSNVLGSGLTLKSQLNHRMLGLTPEQAKEWEDKVEFEFGLWASSKIDHTGLNDFYDAQRIALTGWLMNGDSLAMVKYADTPELLNPYRLRLHLIEADRLNNPDSISSPSSLVHGDVQQITHVELPGGGTIQNGVEMDPSGKVIAYWISNQYPQSGLMSRKPMDWARVDAMNPVSGLPNMLFIMDAERAEQYRGVPYLAPVIEQVKQMNRYTEAEISAAIINSFFTAFIKTSSPEAGNPLGEAIDEEDRLQLSLEERLLSYELGPGTINVLGEGEDVAFGEPKHPISGFDSFTKSMAQLAGASLDMPYEVMLSVFNSSYSASRAALLQAWRSFRDRRDWFSHDFCQPVYETFLFEAVATGRIKAPGFFRDPIRRKLWSQAIWVGPSPGQIDPLKEVLAAEKKIANGFSTHEKETSELTGMDWDSNVEILRREWEARKDLPRSDGSLPSEGGDNENADENRS
ncbi:phage portal protein [Paenibacillus daejeonensis]|uniref:phage portal protein n=1 Tax=Paenibacillus daejeonensis TaxID=135193 RepID=UPI000373B9A5|nr:phage portal protein [Paenibacillus daejeonensis]